MKSILLASLMMSSLALAQETTAAKSVRSSSEIEVSCRVKAKEVAAETYRGCVTEQKNAQIEQIKKEYQAKLQALKSHYESELKKMSGTKAKASIDETDSSSAPAEKTDAKDNQEIKAEESASNTTVKMPTKKAARTAVKKATKITKKSSKSTGPSEMTVQLKPAPVTPMTDDSVMDIPEPTPIENVKTDAAAI